MKSAHLIALLLPLSLPMAAYADDTFTVTPPFERTDIVIPEDLVELVEEHMKDMAEKKRKEDRLAKAEAAMPVVAA